MNGTVSVACLQALLNGSQDIYIIVEKDTLELLYHNPAFATLGLTSDGDGKSYTLNQAPFTPHFSGLQSIINAQSTLLQRHEDPSAFAYVPLGEQDKKHFQLGARLVHVLEEKNAVLLQICAEEYVCHNPKTALNSMERRDALLKAVSRAAQELLSDNTDFDATINTVLGILGDATQVDRVYVWHMHPAPNPQEDDRLYTSQLYEWSEGAAPQQGLEIAVNMPVEKAMPTWINTFLQGKCVNNLVKNMHPIERDFLESQSIISILTAPIILQDHLWGFIGFDNCHAEYTWSQAEEDILRTAGTLISTAIQSRRTNRALYEAQERFCAVEEATGDIIWSVDKEQNINYISPRLTAVLQYEPYEIIGKPFNALLVDQDAFTCTATAENYIMRDFELRAKCKDGSIKWLQSSCKYAFDSTGNMLFGVGSSSDITRMHDTQEALQVANQELEEAIKIANDLVESANKANAIKGSFLANISHEIRTPMNAVVGITHLLKHTKLSPKQLEYVTKISHSSSSLLNIINDILDFSKIQDGNMVIEKHSFSMKAIMDGITQTASHWINEKKLQFTTHIASNVAPRYMGDALRLNQILTSLTTNAIKFTHEGSIHIQVQLESENKDSALLHFSVQDTGIGISQDNIDSLFEGFTQADISNTRRYGGIGLGLALCRNLTALMGGKIWCSSLLGKGSTFHFTCRLEKEHQKPLQVMRPLKEICIAAAMPHTVITEFENMLRPLGYTHIDCFQDIVSLKSHIDSENPPDILLVHEDFSDALLLEKTLQSHDDFVLNIPILYYGTKNRDDLPAAYTILPTLSPSALYNAFLHLLGAQFEADHSLCEHDLEQLLQMNHSGKNILLVEDNEINQMIAQSILEDVGLIITVANDGLEGCELMYQKDFDLVIMDIQMPRMDGLTATKKIREDARFTHIPIIAMTAHATEEDREKSLKAGMNDHTTKPINTAQLFKILLHWLGKTPA